MTRPPFHTLGIAGMRALGRLAWLTPLF
jgi:hypothetical protein